MSGECVYRAIIQYDGTNFEGWQVQPGRATIAGTLQDTFKRVFNTSIRIVGASRTDAGVHAFAQHARFVPSLSIDPKTMCFAWNASLPSSIVISSIETCDRSFHPLYNVFEKEYWYTFSLRELSPFDARYTVYNKKCDIQRLREVLAVFVGTHDFRPLSSGVELDKDTVRTVRSARVVYIGRGRYRIIVRGKSFLRFMIRRMVGAAFLVAGGAVDSAYVRKILDEGIIINALPVAPAQGLMLRSIHYYCGGFKKEE